MYDENDPYRNVYSTPEKFDLTIVGSLFDPYADYSFNDLIVWQHADGRVFYATDSGCSCPSPFEDFRGLEDLDLVTRETWADFQTAVENHCQPYDDDTEDSLAADRTQLLSTVSGLLGPRV